MQASFQRDCHQQQARPEVRLVPMVGTQLVADQNHRWSAFNHFTAATEIGRSPQMKAVLRIRTKIARQMVAAATVRSQLKAAV